MTFEERCAFIKSYFETPAWKNDIQTGFYTLGFYMVLKKHTEKLMAKNLHNLEIELRLAQRGMDSPYSGENALRNRVVNACFRVPELGNILFRPADTAEAVCCDIQAALAQCAFGDLKTNAQYMIERRFHTAEKRPNATNKSFRTGKRGTRKPEKSEGLKASLSLEKKCIVHQQPGCWSSIHNKEQVSAALVSIGKLFRPK